MNSLFAAADRLIQACESRAQPTHFLEVELERFWRELETVARFGAVRLVDEEDFARVAPRVELPLRWDPPPREPELLLAGRTGPARRTITIARIRAREP